jgi:hypothetical protein
MEFKIPLRQKNGEIIDYSYVSEEDYETVMKYKWCKSPDGYARGTVDKKLIMLHQFIKGETPLDKLIDHLDRNKLNNRRSNLSFSTISQNNQNRPKQEGTTSKYRGVFRERNKWRARSAKIHLGLYDDELEAAKKFDTFALLYFGENAKTNNLVNYDEVKGIDINTLVISNRIRELPANVYKSSEGSSFFVDVRYKDFKGYICTTDLEKAIEKSIEFQEEVKKIKEKELEEHNNREITRNKDGIAVIYVKNNKGEQVDEFTVSDDKWHECMLYCWSKRNNYFQTRINGKSIQIHRFIMKAKKQDLIVDHISKDTRDNTTENLRVSTPTGNSHNRTKKPNAQSIYTGVYKYRYKGEDTTDWISAIRKNGTRYYLGRFPTEIEAAIAYNIKAQELYGNHANLNKISDKDYKKYMPEDIPEIDYEDTTINC